MRFGADALGNSACGRNDDLLSVGKTVLKTVHSTHAFVGYAVMVVKIGNKSAFSES